jgi:Na+(H+)/acetate symporter ActP
MRYYTTPSVQEARVSVFWSLFFIFLLYFTAPALAVLVKYEVYTTWWAPRSRTCRHGWPPGRRSIRP